MKRKSFTLIELLVVIAIIGILAATVLVSLNSVKVKAKDARVKGEVAQARNLVQMYLDSGGNVATVSCSPTTTQCDTIADGGNQDLIKLKTVAADIETHLGGGTEGLTVDAVNNSYQVFAKLPSTTQSGDIAQTQVFLINSSGTTQTYPITTAAQLNGTNQSLSLANNNSIRMYTPFTLFGWFNPGAYTAGSTNGTIVGKGSVDAGVASYDYTVFLENGTLRFRVSNGVTNAESNIPSGDSALGANKWTFFVAYYDGSNPYICLNSCTSYAGTSGGPIAIQQTATNLGIGGTTSRFFNGGIDGLGMIKRNLTTDEIAYLYNSGRGLGYTDYPASMKENVVRIDANNNNGGLETLVGGGNMLSYYDSNMEGNNIWTRRRETSVVSSDTTQFYEGSKSIKAVAQGTAADEGIETIYFYVQPSNQYTASAYVKGTAGAIIKLNLVERAADGSSINSNISIATMDGTWKRIVSTGNFSANGAKCSIIISTNTIQSTTFYVDGVQFELGPNAGTWTVGGQAKFGSWGTVRNGLGNVLLETFPSNVYSGYNAVKIYSDGGTNGLARGNTVEVGKYYKITYWAKADANTNFSVMAGGSSSAIQPLTTTYAQYRNYLVASGDTTIRFYLTSAGKTIWIDDVVVEEVPLISVWDFEGANFLKDFVALSTGSLANDLTNNGSVTQGQGINSY